MDVSGLRRARRASHAQTHIAGMYFEFDFAYIVIRHLAK